MEHTMTTNNVSRFANPMLRRLGKVTERTDAEHAATYGGIIGKTFFLLGCTVGGVILQLVLNGIPLEPDDLALSGAGAILLLITAVSILLAPVLSWLIKPLCAFFAILYSISQGYVISFSAVSLSGEYQPLVWLALVLTVLVVSVMLTLYVSGIVKVTHKFRSVLTTLFVSAILGSILIFVGQLIPFTRPFVSQLMGNAAFSMGLSALFVIIAALFLLVDFDTITYTVTNRLPKKTEWTAAFGLVFTVIWLYLKILDLLLKAKANEHK